MTPSFLFGLCDNFDTVSDHWYGEQQNFKRGLKNNHCLAHLGLASKDLLPTKLPVLPPPSFVNVEPLTSELGPRGPFQDKENSVLYNGVLMENSSTVRPPLKRSRPQTAPMQRSPTPTMSHHSNNNNNNFNDYMTSQNFDSSNNNNNNHSENRPPLAGSSSSRRIRPQTAALTKPQQPPPRASFTNGPEESMYGPAVTNNPAAFYYSATSAVPVLAAAAAQSSSSRPPSSSSSTRRARSRPASSSSSSQQRYQGQGQGQGNSQGQGQGLYMGQQQLSDHYYYQQPEQQQVAFTGHQPQSGHRSRPSSSSTGQSNRTHQHHNHHNHHQPQHLSSSLDDYNDGDVYDQGLGLGLGGLGVEDAKLNSLYLWDDFLHSSSTLFTSVAPGSTGELLENPSYQKYPGKKNTSKVKAKLHSRLHEGGASTLSTPPSFRQGKSSSHKNASDSSQQQQQQQLVSALQRVHFPTYHISPPSGGMTFLYV